MGWREKESLRGPKLAVVLGSGMDRVCRYFPGESELRFDEVRGLGRCGVDGHPGLFKWCRVGGKECLFVVGRKHYYEGKGREILLLVNFIRDLGVRFLLLTSAAGALSRYFLPGDLVIVREIIDLQFRKPSGGGLEGEGLYKRGERSGVDEADCSLRPSGGVPTMLMGERPVPRARLSLDGQLTGLLEKAAGEAGIPLRRGILACSAGPAYETPAEVRALRLMGASLVTMSAAPEAYLAAGMGMKVAAIALVSNPASGLSEEKVSHQRVLRVGVGAAEVLRDLVLQLASFL